MQIYEYVLKKKIASNKKRKRKMLKLSFIVSSSYSPKGSFSELDQGIDGCDPSR